MLFLNQKTATTSHINFKTTLIQKKFLNKLCFTDLSQNFRDWLSITYHYKNTICLTTNRLKA